MSRIVSATAAVSTPATRRRPRAGASDGVVVRVVAGAEARPSSRMGLPPHLAALINPDVLARRAPVVAARLSDNGTERVGRR